MNRLNQLGLAAIFAAGLAACASSGPSYEAPVDDYTQYGRVTEVERVWVSEGGRTTGAGVVIGGIVGGVIGHQIGSGRGNDAATVVGVVGGAVVGNEVEKNNARGNGREVYRVSVRLDGGAYRVYEQDSLPNLRAGDDVRVNSGRVSRR